MPKRVYEAHEMAQVYAKMPGEWLLLQILERDENGRARKIRLLHHAMEKEKLREFLLDKEDWTLHSDIVFVYSDPDKICEI